MRHEPAFTVTGAVNAYQYNGKELNSDFGLDWLDYGARWYDASIARWSTIDPLAEDYQSFSPYNYVLNNPLIFIDPDGRSPQYQIVNSNGDILYEEKDADGNVIDDGNVYLAKDGVTNVKALVKEGDKLKAGGTSSNLTALTQDYKIVGTDKQIMDYVKSQVKFSNALNLDIMLSGVAVKTDLDGMLGLDAFTIKGTTLKAKGKSPLLINVDRTENNYTLSNVYNLRNSLDHEGRHEYQKLLIGHTFINGLNLRTVIDGGSEKEIITKFIKAIEADANLHQRSLPSFDKVTENYRNRVEGGRYSRYAKDNDHLIWNRIEKIANKHYKEQLKKSGNE